MTRRIALFLQMLLLVAFGTPVTTSLANALDQRINLTPAFAGAKGEAKFRDRGGEREFQVEAEMSPRFAGAVFTVWVDSQAVGGMVINAFGQGRLSLNSKRGQTVPPIHSGSVVKVKTATGDVVLSGQF
jgi:hypothetical protein